MKGPPCDLLPPALPRLPVLCLGPAGGLPGRGGEIMGGPYPGLAPHQLPGTLPAHSPLMNSPSDVPGGLELGGDTVHPTKHTLSHWCGNSSLNQGPSTGCMSAGPTGRRDANGTSTPAGWRALPPRRAGQTQCNGAVAHVQGAAQITPHLLRSLFTTKIASMGFCNRAISPSSTPYDRLGEMFKLKR